MDNKVTPQQVHGTITLPSGQVISPNSNAVQNNNSNESSENFVKSLKKAASAGVFEKQHGFESNQ